ncbi:hypothetical protein AD928_00570 [Acetobacter cerevisiae]|uniref:Uncharacterized protein n=1 Tax=Acetobacter cerevisiae TaxID=178900 RepID=A0A149QZW4_9PROT|nr:hypothetical protein AD928_00570 [Acetobacter cerevisiae]
MERLFVMGGHPRGVSLFLREIQQVFLQNLFQKLLLNWTDQGMALIQVILFFYLAMGIEKASGFKVDQKIFTCMALGKILN